MVQKCALVGVLVDALLTMVQDALLADALLTMVRRDGAEEWPFTPFPEAPLSEREPKAPWIFPEKGGRVLGHHSQRGAAPL